MTPTPWADPELIARGRLPMHAVPHADRLPLDGRWRFQLLRRPEESPVDSGWREIDVPGCWTMQGTWDVPIYTNVQMPFPHRPPLTPAANPTGVYKRSFEVPAAWAGRRVVLHVGAAESVLIAQLNGREIGISKDSHLAAEFDVTSALRPGANALRLTVVKWSDASFIEDQDQWWHGGITRPVFLYATEPTYLAELRIDAGLEPDLATGTLAIDAALGWPDGTSLAPGWRIEASVEGQPEPLSTIVPNAPVADRGPGAFVVPGPPRRGILDLQSLEASGTLTDPADRASWAEAEAVVRPARVGRVRLTARIPGVTPWSAEVPALQTLTIVVRDPAGRETERFERRIGFRRSEVRGSELLINGRAVLIRGVNRHDFDRRTGRVVSEADMRADVVAMKRWGFNALRTSHYPNDPYLLDVCDELGLYVIDEADIESHGWYDDVCHDPRYRSAFVDRVARMIERDRHHPSIIAWSLGNESGYGVNHDAAAGWARRADPSRPLHYEGAIRFDWASAQTVSDIVCPMYPPISAIVAHARSGRQRHPLIMCEFSHAMGNSNGTLAEYWDAIESTPGLQGGFIWEWRDHGLDQRLPAGTLRAAYGGDFGDVPNDGTFVLDGIVFPDRRPKPAMFEHMFLASPVRVATDEAAIAAAREGRVTLENRGEFRDTDWLRADWEIASGGTTVAGGGLPMPAIAPGERAEVAIPGWQLPPAGAERWLTLRFRTAEASGWAPAGHHIGWAQVPLDGAAPGAAAGTAADWTGDVGLDGEGRLLHPSFAASPALSLWRAPTDNDRIGGMAARWDAWGLASLARRLVAVERATDMVTVRATWVTAAGIEVPHVQRISASRDGARLRVDETVEIPDVLGDLPRVGTVLELAPGYEALEWFGRGPHETYPDRRRGGLVGRWATTVTEARTGYLRPQENGGRADVRWLRLAGGRAGAVRIDLDRPRQVSATHHRAADLDAAAHEDELRPRPETIVHLDAAHRGVGTASCGPDTLEPYVLRPGTFRWTWELSVEAAAG